MNNRQQRLLFVLHRAIIEARLLALGKQSEQIYELMDILDLVPICINELNSLNENESYLDIIRQSFVAYKEKYPTSQFDYIRYLDIDDPPEQYTETEFYMTKKKLGDNI